MPPAGSPPQRACFGRPVSAGRPRRPWPRRPVSGGHAKAALARRIWPRRDLLGWTWARGSWAQRAYAGRPRWAASRCRPVWAGARRTRTSRSASAGPGYPDRPRGFPRPRDGYRRTGPLRPWVPGPVHGGPPSGGSAHGAPPHGKPGVLQHSRSGRNSRGSGTAGAAEWQGPRNGRGRGMAGALGQPGSRAQGPPGAAGGSGVPGGRAPREPGSGRVTSLRTRANGRARRRSRQDCDQASATGRARRTPDRGAAGASIAPDDWRRSPGTCARCGPRPASSTGDARGVALRDEDPRGGGRRPALPTLPVAVAFRRACDGNTAEWEERWQKLAEKLTRRRPGSAGATGEDPTEPVSPRTRPCLEPPSVKPATPPPDDEGGGGEVYVITSAKPRLEPGGW